MRALPPLGMRPDIINDDRARRPQQRSHMHQALLLDRDMPEVRISPSEPGELLGKCHAAGCMQLHLRLLHAVATAFIVLMVVACRSPFSFCNGP